jgi:hypothetical protein
MAEILQMALVFFLIIELSRVKVNKFPNPTSFMIGLMMAEKFKMEKQQIYGNLSVY